MSQYSRVALFAQQSGYALLTDGAGLADEQRRRLGLANIEEEYQELINAPNRQEWIDAIADLIYVVHFAAVMWGLPNPEPPADTPPLATDATVTTWISQPNGLVQDRPTPDTLHLRLQAIYQWIYGQGSTPLINTAFDLVHESNMTKFTTDPSVAADTVRYYEEQYRLGRMLYDTPYATLTNGYYVIRNRSTGKVLKAITYTPAPTLFRANPLIASFLREASSPLHSDDH
jgi:hypothetical protein